MSTTIKNGQQAIKNDLCVEFHAMLAFRLWKGTDVTQYFLGSLACLTRLCLPFAMFFFFVTSEIFGGVASHRPAFSNSPKDKSGTETTMYFAHVLTWNTNRQDENSLRHQKQQLHSHGEIHGGDRIFIPQFCISLS